MAKFRTELALDRTTLAWIRTTLTMATFGFGTVGFFRSLRTASPTPEAVRLHQGAITFGVSLSSTGRRASVRTMGTRFILNIQPVMPFSLNEDWNMITRVIVPFIGQPNLAGGVPASGVGDVLTSFFFSPTGGKVTWGIGPVISLPSTSEPTLGSGKWAAGPTAVVLKQTGPWTVGAL